MPMIRSRLAAEYEKVIIAYRNGAPVRLTDVADVRDDAENVRLAAWQNQIPAVIVNVQRQPSANVIEVVNRIKNIIPQLRASLPGSGGYISAYRSHDDYPRICK